MDPIEQIKQKIDIVDLISEYIPLRKAGRNFKALCPFHGEKTPSFMISPELQIFKCFGCQVGGDAIAFIQNIENLEFREALEFLAKRAGVRIPSREGFVFSQKERYLELNKLASDFYHYVLVSHPVGKKALAYLTDKRGITREAIETFKLGFAPIAADGLSRFLAKKKFTEEEIEKVGLGFPREKGFIDRFRGRVIFPLSNHRGGVVGFAGRLLPELENQDVSKYINTPETLLYQKGKLLYALEVTKQEIKRENSAVVVEGEIDAISCWICGVKNVVAIKGTALTDDQINLTSRFTKNVILGLDSDAAGSEAARRSIELASQTLDLSVISLGGYKDPDELVRSDPQGLKQAVKKPIGIWDFLLGSVFKKYDSTTGEGKARISREATPVLASISDKIVQSHYIKRVAQKLGVQEEAVVAQVETSASFQTRRVEKQKISGFGVDMPYKSRRQALEEHFLGLVFQGNPLVLREAEMESLLSTLKAVKLRTLFLEHTKGKRSFDPSGFARVLPAELSDFFAQLILADLKVEDEAKLAHQITLARQELLILSIKEELEKLSAKMKDLEESKEEEELVRIQRAFAEMTGRLLLEERKTLKYNTKGIPKVTN